MTNLDTLVEPVIDQADYTARIEALGQATEPTIFGMRTKLPSRGRTDMPLAATPRMSLVLSATRSHLLPHTFCHGDHSFVVLQGEVSFFGEDGEPRPSAPSSRYSVATGRAYYRFQAQPGEPVVMIRFGAVVGEDVDQHDRTDTKGERAEGWDAQNKTVPVVLTDELFG